VRVLSLLGGCVVSEIADCLERFVRDGHSIQYTGGHIG
jgi:hypothetical protein